MMKSGCRNNILVDYGAVLQLRINACFLFVTVMCLRLKIPEQTLAAL